MRRLQLIPQSILLLSVLFWSLCGDVSEQCRVGLNGNLCKFVSECIGRNGKSRGWKE